MKNLLCKIYKYKIIQRYRNSIFDIYGRLGDKKDYLSHLL